MKTMMLAFAAVAAISAPAVAQNSIPERDKATVLVLLRQDTGSVSSDKDIAALVRSPNLPNTYCGKVVNLGLGSGGNWIRHDWSFVVNVQTMDTFVARLAPARFPRHYTSQKVGLGKQLLRAACSSDFWTE